MVRRDCNNCIHENEGRYVCKKYLTQYVQIGAVYYKCESFKRKHSDCVKCHYFNGYKKKCKDGEHYSWEKGRVTICEIFLEKIELSCEDCINFNGLYKQCKDGERTAYVLKDRCSNFLAIKTPTCPFCEKQMYYIHTLDKINFVCTNCTIPHWKKEFVTIRELNISLFSNITWGLDKEINYSAKKVGMLDWSKEMKKYFRTK